MFKKLLILIAFLVPAYSHAAVLQFTGGETGSAGDVFATSGTVSLSTTTVKHGAFSLRSNATPTGLGYFEIRATNASGTKDADFSGISTTSTSFWMYVSTFPTNGKESFASHANTANGAVDVLYLNPEGTITIRGALATSWIATTTTVISADTWYHICMTVSTGSAAPYDLKINGVTDVSGTGNFSSSATRFRYARVGKTVDTNGSSPDMYFDTVVIDSTDCSGSTDEIRAAMPDAPGTYSTWTGGTGASDWTQVDERPSDNNTSYVATSSQNYGKFSVQASSTANVGITGTVKAVKALVATVEAVSTTLTNFQTLFISGATEATTTSHTTMTNSYLFQEMFYTTDPNTGSAWTTAALDDVEAGGVSVTASTTSFRISQVSIHALFTPSAGGGGGGEFNPGYFFLYDDE